MSARKRKLNGTEIKNISEKDVDIEPIHYKIKPDQLLNIYKEPDPMSKVIGCISEKEIGTISMDTNGLGYVIEKSGWVNLSKVTYL